MYRRRMIQMKYYLFNSLITDDNQAKKKKN